MWRWAYRSFLEERASLAASAGGVAAMFLLVLMVEGAFQGEADQTAALIERSPAPVWVMQDGVSNVHMASSSLSEAAMRRARSVPGVAYSEGILYGGAVSRFGDTEPPVYLIGIRPGQRSAPWAIAAGKRQPDRGEVVVPEVLARRGGVPVGGTVEIDHRRFRVVGLSRGTYSMASSLVFMHASDLAALFDVLADANYLLVWPAPGVPVAALVARIRAAVPEVSVLDRDVLARNDRALALQMGGELIRIMALVAALVASLIVGFTVFTFTARRARELAVARAVGARAGQLVVAAVAQAAGLALLGYLIATILALVLQPAFSAWSPGIVIHFSPASVLRMGGAALAVAVIAGLIPAWRVVRIDPTLVFSS